jgi:hypothetical protein
LAISVHLCFAVPSQHIPRFSQKCKAAPVNVTMKKLFGKLKQNFDGKDEGKDDGKASKPSSSAPAQPAKALQQGATVDAGRAKEIAAMLGQVGFYSGLYSYMRYVVEVNRSGVEGHPHA